MDLSDITKPKPDGKVQYEFNALGTIPFHTCYPVIADAAHPRLQNLIVATHEALEADCREVYHTPYVVDVKDPRNPKIIGFFPRPAAPPDAPYSDFCFARGRFGSHNTQCWLAPGTSRPEIIAIAWFNAGIRIFDLSNPTAPKEVGVLRAAARGRNRQLRKLVARFDGKRFRRVGSQPDLDWHARRQLLSLLPGARQAGAGAAQGGALVGGSLQCRMGRSDIAQLLLWKRRKPSGIVDRGKSRVTRCRRLDTIRHIFLRCSRNTQLIAKRSRPRTGQLRNAMHLPGTRGTCFSQPDRSVMLERAPRG